MQAIGMESIYELNACKKAASWEYWRSTVDIAKHLRRAGHEERHSDNPVIKIYKRSQNQDFDARSP